MKLRKNLNKTAAVALSFMLAASLSVTASAWGENPGWADVITNPTETAAPVPEETTEPELVLDGEPVDEEETESPDENDMPEEDIVEEIPEDEEDPEETEPADTEPAVTEPPVSIAETTTTTTTTVPINTAPATYDEVTPFEMFVPDTLNVRGGPGTNYDKLGMAYPSTTVKVIGKSGDWYVIDYYGAPGYLLAELLVEVPDEPVTTTPAPETADTQPPVESEAPEETTEDNIVPETAPLETEPVETEPEPEETTAKTEADDEKEDKEDDEKPAASVKDDNKSTSFPSVLVALGCGLAAFILVGVIPVLIHKAHHKKLYQY